jgi:hypothetical protein
VISNVDEAARLLTQSKLRLRDIAVRVDAEESSCPICGASLAVIKTSFNGIVTNGHGPLNAWWPTQGCPQGCKAGDGQAFTRRAGKLSELAMKKHKFGYDLEVEIGIRRYLKHMQISEIQEGLEAEGKKISPASISRYSYQFLDHLERLHVARLPALGKRMADEGGYYMLFDSTCEAGMGSLFNVMAGWKNWTLGSWRQATENSSEMLPHVMYLIKAFGPPLAVMKDLGKQGRKVAEGIKAAYPAADIRIFACHFHFAKDIGKDILAAGHNELKGRISDAKSSLARLVCETRGKVTDSPEIVALKVETWMSDPGRMAAAMGSGAIAATRYLAQWVLDSAQDGGGSQFPFVLPYLLFYDRAARMANITSSILKSDNDGHSSAAYKMLAKLLNITAQLSTDRKTANIAESLRLKNNLFNKLRQALRLENIKDINGRRKTAEEGEEASRKVKDDFGYFTAALKKQHDSCKTTRAMKTAIGWNR